MKSGVEQLVARQTHNLKVEGSNPSSGSGILTALLVGLAMAFSWNRIPMIEDRSDVAAPFRREGRWRWPGEKVRPGNPGNSTAGVGQRPKPSIRHSCR
jgi:hypothetical protein